jgi:hypothetical protein
MSSYKNEEEAIDGSIIVNDGVHLINKNTRFIRIWSYYTFFLSQRIYYYWNTEKI